MLSSAPETKEWFLEQINDSLIEAPKDKPSTFMFYVYHHPILDLIVRLSQQQWQGEVIEELSENFDSLSVDHQKKYRLYYFASTKEDSNIAVIRQCIEQYELSNEIALISVVYDKENPQHLQQQHFVDQAGTLILYQGDKLLFRHGQSASFMSIARERYVSDGELTKTIVSELMQSVKEDFLKFHHKRLAERYILYFIALKRFVGDEGTAIFHAKIDSIIGQFKLACSVVSKGRSYLSVYRDARACDQQMRAMNDSNPQLDMRITNFSLTHWSDVLLLRLILEMRRQIVDEVSTNNTILSGVYFGFKFSSSSRYERMSRQFDFSLKCYQLSLLINERLIAGEENKAMVDRLEASDSFLSESDCSLAGYSVCSSEVDLRRQSFSASVGNYVFQFYSDRGKTSDCWAAEKLQDYKCGT